MPKLELTCEVCKNNFFRYECSLKDNQKYFYCSKKCRYAHQAVTQAGENNSNFGHKWSSEKKERQAALTTKMMTEKGEVWRKENCGKSNRGAKRSEEFLTRWHATQKDPNYVRPPVTEERRKEIGIKSAKKFTPEYKKRFRKKMEETGLWLPKTEEHAYKFYRDQCGWVQRMWDLVQLPNDFNEVGVFNSWKNQKGYIRDHKFSRHEGFINGVFPAILRHPANCEIITHSKNVQKRTKSSLSLEDLFTLIEGYQREWIEQELCLKLIAQYKQNNKWSLMYE